jgi:hypothetical protein
LGYLPDALPLGAIDSSFCDAVERILEAARIEAR